MIELDGNFGEGGGSIVRMALALSTLTGKSFSVKDIRKGRTKPGLKAQHLCGIKGIECLCNGIIKGAEIGSEKIEFQPGKITSANINLDIGTAGAMTLVLQSLLLPAFFGEKKTTIELTGATDTKWSPQIDYFKEVIVPHLRRFCKKIEVRIIRRGYFPKGQGKIIVEITPLYKLKDYSFNFEELKNNLKKEQKQFDLKEQNHLVQVKGISHASIALENARVAERTAAAAKLILGKLNCPINIKTEYANSESIGSGITLWAIFSEEIDEINFNYPIRLGTDILGQKGIKAEIVGVKAAENLIKEINSIAPIDKFLADNLIPWLALFGGSIKCSEITNHTLTNIYVIEQFLGKIFLVNTEDKTISVI